MREQKRQEHRLQLVAGRHGLKLVKNRHRVAVYCLRAVWNAAYVVGRRSDGELGLVYAQTGREEIACWLTLTEIERVARELERAGAEGVGRASISAQRSPLRQLSQTSRRVRHGGERRRSPRYRLTLGPSDASPSAAPCRAEVYPHSPPTPSDPAVGNSKPFIHPVRVRYELWEFATCMSRSVSEIAALRSHCPE